MDIFKTFATDKTKELTGAWVDLSTAEPEEGKKAPRIKVARLGNRIHSGMMTKLYKENRLALADKDEDKASEIDEKLNIEACSKAILLGWEGLEYPNSETGESEVIEYSQVNAVKLLEHSDFRNLVMAHARNFENFRAERVGQAKKG